MLTTLTQNQRNVFSFMWKKTATLYWNLRTSELSSVFFFFFDLLLLLSQLLGCCWGKNLNRVMSIIVFFYWYFDLKVKKNLLRRLHLDESDKHSNSYISPPKVWRYLFQKKAFYSSGVKKPFWANLWRTVLHGGLMIRSCHEW